MGSYKKYTWWQVNTYSTTKSEDSSLSIVPEVEYLAELIKATLTNFISNVLKKNLELRSFSDNLFGAFDSEGSIAGLSPIWNFGKSDAMPEQRVNVIIIDSSPLSHTPAGSDYVNEFEDAKHWKCGIERACPILDPRS